VPHPFFLRAEVGGAIFVFHHWAWMLPRLSQRTFDLMQRAIAAVENDAADLITTLVASAFADGRSEAEGNTDRGDKEEQALPR